MKIKLLLYTFVIGASLYLFTGFTTGLGATDRTGGGTATQSCQNCHTVGTAGTYVTNATFGFRDLAGLAQTSYNPGQEYLVGFGIFDLSMTAPAGYGFQLKAEIGGVVVNGWSPNVASPSTVISGGAGPMDGAFVGHNAVIPVGSPQLVGGNWTAPAAGAGDVTFYWAVNAVNGMGNTAGDNVVFGSATIPEAALPVSLSGFTARTKGEGNELYWITETEVNSAYFEVQRSTDGLEFTTIGEVEAKGNSAEKVYYTFMDTDKSSSNVYYRLKQIDLDGKFEFSKIITVKGTEATSVTVYPNPVTDFVNVTLVSEASELSIKLFDAYGKLIEDRFVNQYKGVAQSQTFDLKDKAAGLYVIQVVNGKETTAYQIVKQ